MKHGEVKPEALMTELRAIDEVIMRVSCEGSELIKKHAPTSAVDCAADFLQTLWSRRKIILHELHRLNVSRKEVAQRIGAIGEREKEIRQKIDEAVERIKEALHALA